MAKNKIKRKQASILEDRIICQVCGKSLKFISSTHLLMHNLTPEEYKKEYKVSHLMCQEARDKISNSRNSKDANYFPYTKQELINSLKGYGLKKDPLTYTWLKKEDPVVAKQACYTFGSWKAALKESGLNGMKFNSWSKQKIISQIKKFHARYGCLSDSFIRKKKQKLYASACLYFQGWMHAVEASGFNYSDFVKTKDRSLPQLAKDLKEWSKEHGALNASEIRKEDLALYTAASKRFGSIEAAAKELGLPYYSKLKYWTKERVAEEIKERDRIGLSLKPSRIIADNFSLYKAMRRYFNSWKDAVAYSGCKCDDYFEHNKYTDEILMKALQEWNKKHGVLNSTTLKLTDSVLFSAVNAKYGSVEKAAKKAGLPYKSRLTRWSPEKVLAALRNRAAKGKIMRPSKVREDNRSLYNAIRRYFGSFTKVMKHL